MSDYRFSFPACMTAAKGRIDPHDVILLRKFSFPDGVASRELAESLVALHHACPDQCAEWDVFFVEALADFIIHREHPYGRLDDAKVTWMIQAFAHGGVVKTKLELDAIVHAAELAHDTPASLSSFILDQIRRSLLPDRRGAHATFRPPLAAVTAYDLALVWQVLRTSLHAGRLVLSPKERMLLRAIDLLTDDDQDHPLWREMIAQIKAARSPTDTLRSLARSMAAKPPYTADGFSSRA
jgi:hypothetical protein